MVNMRASRSRSAASRAARSSASLRLRSASAFSSSSRIEVCVSTEAFSASLARASDAAAIPAKASPVSSELTAGRAGASSATVVVAASDAATDSEAPAVPRLAEPTRATVTAAAPAAAGSGRLRRVRRCLPVVRAMGFLCSEY